MPKRYGIVIDLSRCFGCETCSVACKVENGLDGGSWISVNTIGGSHRDTPRGRYPFLTMYYVPRMCMHCQNPPCLDICPSGAIFRRKGGIVLIDESECNGCRECIQACPYEALRLNEGKGIAEKCDLCANRLDKGLMPFCVTCCPAEALYFGDLNDPQSRVSKIISDKHAFIFVPQCDTQPSIYYCPPHRLTKEAVEADLHNLFGRLRKGGDGLSHARQFTEGL